MNKIAKRVSILCLLSLPCLLSSATKSGIQYDSDLFGAFTQLSKPEWLPDLKENPEYLHFYFDRHDTSNYHSNGISAVFTDYRGSLTLARRASIESQKSKY